VIGVLAKSAGQDSSRGMAHWAKLRTHELSKLFHLKRECMPHYSTWSRILGLGVEPNEVEQIVGRFAGTGHQNSSAQAGQYPPGN
jgi:hypothetical protein